MRGVELILYREEDGTVPFVNWLKSLPLKPGDKVVNRVKRLREHGRGFRGREPEHLGEGICQLSVRFDRSNYWILYFFWETTAVVVLNGIAKGGSILPGDIDKAANRKSKFEANPVLHAFPWENG